VKVLYLCHRIPYPPDKGDKIRAFHQLQAIAAQHEVDLFTLADDASDLAHQDALRQYCRQVTVARLNPKLARLRSLPYLLTAAPLTIPYFYSAELRDEVRKAVATRAYDRIFVYCSAMAQYVDPAWGIPVVTDFVDVDSDKWRQYATFTSGPSSVVYRREAWALRRYERQICEMSSCIVVTTGREAALVKEISDRAPVHEIPNGVDTGYFQPAAVPPDAGAPTVGFTGDMSYFPNIEAVISFSRNVLPLIRRTVPETRFLIVGRNPSASVKALTRIEGVEVTGFVPDIRQYLARMHVAVAPFSIAAGIQNKILEAMASGIPIVCTSRAAQGLSPTAAAAVELADGAEELAAKIVGLLRNPGLAHRKGIQGRAQVMTEYHWDQSLARLLHLLEEPTTPQPSVVCARLS
jgi:sugar transferase (PEP-CTERM/EpsH1 system associated)